MDLTVARAPAPGGRWALAALALAAFAPALALGANRPAFWAPMAAAALLLLVLRRPVPPPPLAGALALAALAWAAAQALAGLTPDIGQSWRAVARLAACLALFLAAATLARDLGAARRLTRLFALWSAALCLYGLAAWARGANPIVGPLEAYPAALEGPFVYPNAFALYAGFGALAALAALVMALAPDGARPGRGAAARRLARGGWVWAAAMAVCLSALAATGSRGGAAATALGLAAFALPFLRGPAARAAAALAGLFAAGAAAFAAALFARAEGAAPLVDDRVGVWAATAEGIAAAPLTGHGFGAFADAFRPFGGEAWRWGDWDHAHQLYLELAFELGLPAALALVAAAALTGAAACAAARRRRRAAPVAALGFAALVAAGAQGLVDFTLAIPAVAAALSALLGAAWAQAAR